MEKMKKNKRGTKERDEMEKRRSKQNIQDPKRILP
jgi:hypothetical protein